MTCPECSWQNASEQKFCIKCGLFLLDPQTHWRLASNGRRLGAFLMDILLIILTLGVGWIVWFLVVANEGKSPGKQVLGLTIINAQGRPIGFWHHLILRELLGKALIDSVTYGIYFLLDHLWLLWDRHHQCLHDKIAGTYVARNPLGGSQTIASQTSVSSEPTRSETNTSLDDSQAVAPPTPVSSEPTRSETNTSLDDSQAVAPPTPVSSEPTRSETNTSLDDSQAVAPPTPVSSKPIRSQTETSFHRDFKALIFLCGLFVLAFVVTAINSYAGLVFGLIFLVVPGIAIFKPIPRIWLGHRGLNFCLVLFVGVWGTFVSLVLLDNEANLQELRATNPEAYLEEIRSNEVLWLRELKELDPDRWEAENNRIAEEQAAEAAEEERKRQAALVAEAAATATALVPTPTATAAPPTATPTPLPTATPTPPPIFVEIDELLNEYSKNKVRAKVRFAYQENGKTPLTTSGYVSTVEELYVGIESSQSNWDFSSYRGVNCYYSNVEAALHVTKGQLITITGKVSREDELFNEIAMFACEIEGLSLPTLPIVPSQAVRENTVRVVCISDLLIVEVSYEGTGVIIDPKEGIILTVHHVISDDCERIEVEIPGLEESVPASIIKHCASIDRALLRIPPQALAGLTMQPVYRAAAPAQVDQEIYFWGFGTGQLRLETGVVMSTWGDDTDTDAYAIPGDSGSPVYNEYGHLLGTMSRSNVSDRALYTGNQC